MVQRGDRYRFTPHSGNRRVVAQTVVVQKVVSHETFWCSVRDVDDADVEVMCRLLEVPGYGSLERIDDAVAKQHDQITLEEWRQKARSPDWPWGH